MNPRSKRTETKIREKDIARLVVDWLSAKRIWHMRVQSGKVKSAMGGWVQLAPAGTADYQCIRWIPRGSSCGSFVCKWQYFWKEQEVTWIELKRPKGGKHSESQQAFQREVQELGHRYFIVTSLEELEAAFK